MRNFVLVFIFFVSVAFSDVLGSSDHPAIGRFKGSEIIGYKSADYDELVLALGPQIKKGNDVVFSKSLSVEGKMTRILYLTPKGASTLQVIKSYKRELRSEGFKILFFCKKKRECGQLITHTEPFFRKELYEYIWEGIKSPAYISAKLSKNGKNIYVSIFVFEHEYPLRKFKGRVLVQLDIVEEEALAEDLIVSSSQIEKKIKEEGKIAIYGIYFDHNSAEIKPESEPTIEQIAIYLKDNPSIKLYVVGHTDNTGSYEYNLKLSMNRAKAVVNKLISEYGINPNRLKAVGVGPVAPIDSNETEEGRSRNRRVELVQM